MATVPKSAIDGGFTGQWLEDRQDLFDHNGAMRARWGLATGEYLLDVLNIALRLVLFVLLIESTRVLARIAFASWRFASR